jgi:outer membrane lipoprotein-sorting protein
MGRPFQLAATAAVLLLVSGAARAQTVDDIIAANIKSKGGVARIKATTTVRMSGSVVARDMNGRDLSGTMTMVAKRPNLMRRDATVNGQQITNAFDGASLWMAMGTMPAQELPGTQAAYARQDAEFDSVFVDYKEKGFLIELIGKEKLDGADVYHLKLARKGGPPRDYYLDSVTGLEKKIVVSVQSPDGSPVTSVTEFSDYRTVEGCLVPFVLKQRQNGTLISTTTLDKIEFNVPVEDVYFKMPAKQLKP